MIVQCWPRVLVTALPCRGPSVSLLKEEACTQPSVWLPLALTVAWLGLHMMAIGYL